MPNLYYKVMISSVFKINPLSIFLDKNEEILSKLVYPFSWSIKIMSISFDLKIYLCECEIFNFIYNLISKSSYTFIQITSLLNNKNWIYFNFPLQMP